jgi:hypothetical protein
VAGAVSVSATATPASGTSLSSLSISIDGSPVVTGASSPQSFAWDTTSVANGTHTITSTAIDADGGTATSTVTVTVKNIVLYSTTTSLSSSVNPSVTGQPVTYTATVSPVPDGGTVGFQDGGADIGGCAAVSVDTTTGQATCQVTYGSVGSHAITATYSGHGNYQGSTSNTLTQQVNPADSDLGLTGMPADITTTATSPAGAVVTYTSPKATDESGDSTAASVSCAPAPGSTFPVGTTTVTCTATDSDDANSPVSQSFTVTVTPVLTVAAKNISPTEGKAFSGTVASGTDYEAGTLKATINWGDGNSSAGSVNLSSNGSYSVMGSHTYAEEGTYTLTVTVSASGGQSAASSSSAKVADAALTFGKVTATVSGLQVSVSAPLTDADPNGTATDYTATIAWGDGTTGPATIGTSGSGFTAGGAHTYKAHGTYSATITITDTGGTSAKTKITIKV